MTDDLEERLREAAEYWDECRFHVTAQRDRKAADRIKQLEEILKRAVDGYNQAYCRDEVNFDWVEDAETALGEKKDVD